MGEPEKAFGYIPSAPSFSNVLASRGTAGDALLKTGQKEKGESMISATVVGNLGSDAERREAGDTSVLSFNVASNSKRKVRGEWVEEVTWVRVSFFGARADAIAEYLTKGKQVAVRGALTLQEYETKEGETRRSLECRADDIQLLGSASGNRSPKEESREKPRGEKPASKPAFKGKRK